MSGEVSTVTNAASAQEVLEHPADEVLNLPAGRYSHRLRRLAAAEAVRGSFDDAAAAVERAITVRIGERHVEQLAPAAAVDVDAIYTAHAPALAPDGDVVCSASTPKGW